MKQIEELFTLHRAKSDIFSRYQSGDVPYVGNGLSDNAIVGLISPLQMDKVFHFAGIAISAFCEASVQVPPYVACGRAGNGLVVLEPKKAMTLNQLAYIAAYLNTAVRWRFSWYRQTTADRLKRLKIPDPTGISTVFNVRAHMPEMSNPESGLPKLKFERFSLGEIYDLKPGHFHSVGQLRAGAIPIVSCGDLDNGICGYFDVATHIDSHKLTIAFNGATLSAKYHPYSFSAKDDVAICNPIKPLRLTTQLFIQLMLQRERWRFSYYRKCYSEKLARVTIPLPSRNGELDELAIENVIQSTPYWKYLRERLRTTS